MNRLFGLNLSVISFDLPVNLIKESENIMVGITTFPEENMQEFTIPARKMKNPYLNYNFNVKIASENLPKDVLSLETEAIFIVFKKKSFFHSDPVIAFTKIPANEFPKSMSEPVQLKNIDIFKIINFDKNENIYNDIYTLQRNSYNEEHNFKITGKMNISMTLTNPFQLNEFLDNSKLDALNDNSFNSKSAFGQKLFRFKKLNK